MAKGAVPTRDELLDFIRKATTPVGKREIARAFGLKGDQRIELKALLRDLRDNGEIAADRAKTFRDPGALADVAILEIVSQDRDGHLLAVPRRHDPEVDGPAPRIEIAPGGARGGPAPGVGDRVLASLRRRGADRYEARIIRRLGSGPKTILGLVEGTTPSGSLRVAPTDRKVRGPFEVRVADAAGAEEGDVVWIEETGAALSRRARVLERLGRIDDPRTVSLIAIAANGIPVDFPPAALEEAESARAAPLGARLDLRVTPLVTIDGENARDFDDAVYAEPDSAADNPGGFRILVAIADVAWYVRPDSPLDRAAWRRGNSVYFPDRVVPMLPEALSNHWCSLVPREDRPVMVADMRIGADGKLRGHSFHRALIRSAARLTYTRLQAARDGAPDDEIAPLMSTVVHPLYAAYAALLAARERRGALDLELPERVVRIGGDGSVADIGVRARLDSHRLIEEFMILANVAAAETLERHRLPCLYRIHDRPDPGKIEGLRGFLETLDLSLAAGPRLRPADLNALLAKVVGTPHQRLVNETVLRSQSQAVYSPDNVGHFGLALAHYAHFTSPIRRYSDLLVHRALLLAIGGGDGALPRDSGPRFVEHGEHLSMCERRAIAAERSATDRYLAAFMSGRVGAEFDGRVNGVARFGLFITLDETGADGLLPIRDLGREFFRHDEGRQMLVGQSTGESFGLGDRLRVRLVEANAATGGLLFSPVRVLERVARKGAMPTGRVPRRPAARGDKGPHRRRR